MTHTVSGRTLSPRDLGEKLRGLPGVDASLPENEIRRLESLLPRAISPEMVRKIQLLQENTEGNIPPYIQQIPATFVVDGVEREFTLASFEEVWSRARLADDNPDGEFSIYIGHEQQIGDEIVTRPKWTRSNMLGLYDTKSISEKIRDRVCREGKLRAYSAGCLRGSQEIGYLTNFVISVQSWARKVKSVRMRFLRCFSVILPVGKGRG